MGTHSQVSRERKQRERLEMRGSRSNLEKPVAKKLIHTGLNKKQLEVMRASIALAVMSGLMARAAEACTVPDLNCQAKTTFFSLRGNHTTPVNLTAILRTAASNMCTLVNPGDLQAAARALVKNKKCGDVVILDAPPPSWEEAKVYNVGSQCVITWTEGSGDDREHCSATTCYPGVASFYKPVGSPPIDAAQNKLIECFDNTVNAARLASIKSAEYKYLEVAQ